MLASKGGLRTSRRFSDELLLVFAERKIHIASFRFCLDPELVVCVTTPRPRQESSLEASTPPPLKQVAKMLMVCEPLGGSVVLVRVTSLYCACAT